MTPEKMLVLLVLLQFKHLLADYVWQSIWMVGNKGNYGHPGGLAHAGMHAGFSLIAFLIMGVDIGLALSLSVAELVIHYHVDFLKDRLQRGRNLDPHNRVYWIFHGVDQFAHQATMVAMVACVLWFG